MADTRVDTAVSVETSAQKLPDGVIDLNSLAPDVQGGCRVFVHYNGPTDQLSGMCTGMAEFLIIADGTGEIECDGQITQVGPGAIMYCAGNVLHGITNTGKVPLTFYWSKWMAKRF